MLNFDDIEHLVSYMFENLDNEDNNVTVITNKEMAIEIMKELLDYNNVILDSCDIDFEEEYDREYIVSLVNDVVSDNWYVNVKKCYLQEKDKYVSTDGYVLFHEDVNSKAMIDMQNNEYMPLCEHDWFIIGEDIEYEDEESVEHNYMVNGKSVDKETFNKYVSKFAPDLVDGENDTSDNDDYSITVKCSPGTHESLEIIKDMERRTTHIDDMFREVNCFRRLFNW